MNGLVFDLDDTLLPERDWILSGFNAVETRLRSRGIRIGRVNGIEKMLAAYASDSAHVFDALAQDPEIGVEPRDRASLVSDCVRTYREHLPSLSLSPDVRELLVWARQRLRVAIATAGHPSSQRAKIAATGLEELVDVILYGDGLPDEHIKPDTRWFLKVADLLSVSPTECLHVGDNPRKDFVPAKAVGMTTVRIRTAGGVYAHLEGPGIDYEVSDVTQLRDVIESFVAHTLRSERGS